MRYAWPDGQDRERPPTQEELDRYNATGEVQTDAVPPEAGTADADPPPAEADPVPFDQDTQTS